jgi:signal peptidase II
VIASFALLLSVAAAVVALDQWTKQWATRALQYREPVELIGEFVRFTYTRNSGVAFGLGAGLPFPYYVFSIAAVSVIVYLFARRRVPQFPRQLALALILGGAIGNLIDRITSGEVVDFIEVGYGRWHWPVFNVADSAVTIGVVLFAIAWPHPRGAEPAGPTAGDDEPSAGAVGPDPERGGAPGSLPRGGASGPLA